MCAETCIGQLMRTTVYWQFTVCQALCSVLGICNFFNPKGLWSTIIPILQITKLIKGLAQHHRAADRQNSPSVATVLLSAFHDFMQTRKRYIFLNTLYYHLHKMAIIHIQTDNDHSVNGASKSHVVKPVQHTGNSASGSFPVPNHPRRASLHEELQQNSTSEGFYFTQRLVAAPKPDVEEWNVDSNTPGCYRECIKAFLHQDRKH